MDSKSNSKLIDLMYVQKMTGCSLDLFGSLVEIFTAESRIQMAKIEESIISADPSGLDNSAHSFKSSLSTLGALNASVFANQLEQLGKTGSVEGAAEIFEKLKMEQEKVTDYFESRQWVEDWDISP